MESLKDQLRTILYMVWAYVESYIQEKDGWENAVGFVVARALKLVYNILFPLGALILYISLYVYEYLYKWSLTVYEQIKRQKGGSKSYIL